MYIILLARMGNASAGEQQINFWGQVGSEVNREEGAPVKFCSVKNTCVEECAGRIRPTIFNYGRFGR